MGLRFEQDLCARTMEFSQNSDWQMRTGLPHHHLSPSGSFTLSVAVRIGSTEGIFCFTKAGFELANYQTHPRVKLQDPKTRLANFCRRVESLWSYAVLHAVAIFRKQSASIVLYVDSKF